MIRECEAYRGQYVILSGGKRLPGNYADKATAYYAFQFAPEELLELQNHALHKSKDLRGRVTTMEDLKKTKRHGLVWVKEARMERLSLYV